MDLSSFDLKAVQRTTPSNWVITANDGTNLTATNTKTGEVFNNGTTAAFNAIFKGPAPVQMDLMDAVVKSAVPIIVPSGGTVATTTGVLTLTVALPTTYLAGWFYLPATAVTAGNGAGFYFGVMTDTTHVNLTTEYVDPSTGPFTGNLPANAIVSSAGVVSGLTALPNGTGSGYTQTVTALVALNYFIPGNMLGNNGVMYMKAAVANSNTAQSKVATVALGASTIATVTNTTTTVAKLDLTVSNRNMSNRQIIVSQIPATNATTATLGVAYTSIDTGAAAGTNLKVSLTTVASATDFAVLEYFQLQLM